MWAVVLLATCRYVPCETYEGAPSRAGEVTSVQHTKALLIPIVEGKDVTFHEISNPSALSQTRVVRIVRDHRGFMWFGTQYGLDRFDGTTFKNYVPEPGQANSLGGAYVHSLFVDRSGKLWIGCDQFLDRFDPTTETFTHFQLLSAGEHSLPATVFDISQDSHGELWLATGSGLYGFDPSIGKAIRHYTHDPGDTFSLNSNDLRSSGEDRSGRFWVIERYSLEELDRDSGRVVLRVPLPEVAGESAAFFEDHSGTFWILYEAVRGSGGIAILNRESKTLTNVLLIDSKTGRTFESGALAMIEDEDGNNWLATEDRGLLKFDRKRRLMFSYRHRVGESGSIAEDRIISTGKDSQGNIWLGFYARAPNSFSPSKPSFSPLMPPSLASNSFGESTVNAICKDKDGNVWVGITGSLIRLDAKSTAYRVYQPSARDTTRFDPIAISEAPDGNLWVGTAGQGLYHFDPRNGAFRNYHHIGSDPDTVSNNMVQNIFFDRGGIMWLATGDGIDRFNSENGTFASYKRDPENSTEYYYEIAEDREGWFWLSGPSGLQRFDPKTGGFHSFEHRVGDPVSLSDNRVNSVHIDNSGTVWVATESGLGRLNTENGKFTNYYVSNGLPSNRTNCIREDLHGELWISTTRGLSEFDPKSESFRNFSVSDGLPGMDFTGWLTCYAGSDGRIYFGGFSGATEFDPARISNDKYVSPVVFTDFRLFGKPVKAGDESPLRKSISYADTITLSYTQNAFSLEFAALDYSNPSIHRFRYRLEHLDKQWNETDASQAFVSYSSVPPGTYTLRVQIATPAGGWSTSGATLHITVLPPWWGTWWFRMVCVVSLLGAAFAAISYRTRGVLRRFEMRLRERLEERTRIARELHDTLLQSLHGLLFQFQAIRNMLPDRVDQAIGGLDSAITRTEQTITESQIAIQDLRHETLKRREFSEQLVSTSEELLELLGRASDLPPIRVIAEGERRALSPIFQEELCSIVRELLLNALKHSKAHLIEAEIRYDEHLLRVRVRDDGAGIDREILKEGKRPGHWGLAGVQERAKLIGAVIDFWAEDGVGTEVEVSTPASIAYAKN